MSSGLPIESALPALLAALAGGRSAVLQAPPGAGKSTVVPLVLMQQEWARNRRIMMLEPRRLAARAVARRMASTLGEEVGRTVGYRMRMDTRVSAASRIEVVTEGVLTRMLQRNPELPGYAAVIFDEFHERSLQADLGLALTLDARDSLGLDLRVLVMSATLDGEAIARLLDGAPVVTAQGRQFPVQSRFEGKGMPLLPDALAVAHDTPEKAVARLVERALREAPGDILVFLPGAREIRRVQSLLQSNAHSPPVRCLPLYGELSGDEQEDALRPAPGGKRKVVLSTNIAETSLTIEGIRIVVDSGLVRRAVFDPATGMSRLETQRISRASADQRQGRAGRLGPGVSFRAWSEGSHRSLAPFSPPEIADADLVPLALELACWGVREPTDLRWLDPPPAATLAGARDLLRRLGALDVQGRVTPHGREMSGLTVHPRLAHMLVRGRRAGSVALAADLATLLSDRDVLRSAPAGGAVARDADIRTRLDLLRGEKGHARGEESGSAYGPALQRARAAARQLVRQLGSPRTDGPNDPSSPNGPDGPEGSDRDGHRDAPGAGVLLAFAYPDRIGRRREGTPGRYTLANGRGAHFAEAQSLARSELIVAVDLDDRDRDARILLAAPLERTDLEQFMPERLEVLESVRWDAREQAVLARRLVRLDEITLEEKPLLHASADALRAAMLEGIRELGIESLSWTREALDLQARVRFARACAGGSWPDLSAAALVECVGDWLPPWLTGITRRDHLARIPVADALRARLTWEQQRELDRLAPTHLQVPSGSRIRIDYLDESAPVVSVRLQEVFGLQETPRIAGGRIPITFKLLSPAQRPVQVTGDLAGFWRGSYAEVRKDMRGRYPRHYWPENPLQAEPTRGARRRPG